MLTDPIADFLTRLRNASSARRKVVTAKHSKLVKNLANVLMSKHFIQDVQELKTGAKSELKVHLLSDRGPLFLKRVSKPGQRIYVGFENIKRVRNGIGISIISTSKGLMTGEEARKNKLGGEYICDVY